MGEKYVAFLRGINVGGHHKVPMAELRAVFEKLKLTNVVTLLNSGNIVFESPEKDKENLEKKLADHLANKFEFPIPTILRKSDTIYRLLEQDPFKDIILTKDIRLYISFLRKDTEINIPLPWTNEDKSFKIISASQDTICSILDLAISNTPKGMEALEKMFGSDITTRNWNTIKRVGNKLGSG